MSEKSTGNLEKLLGKTHVSDFSSFYEENKESMIREDKDFSAYIKNILAEKKLSQQTVFLRADIPERYGYKLLSGEKRTRQRDIILRICYAGELSLEETQRAPKKYEMPGLYAKIPRDALLMIVFRERPGSIIEVNEWLKENDMEPLRTSGLQD